MDEAALPEVPPLLKTAALAWRWAQPDDLRFVVTSWFDSGLHRFLRSGRPLPREDLSDVVAKALRDANEKLLARVWHAEAKSYIAANLLDAPCLVIYDTADSGHILAWRHRDFAYTKQLARRQGLQRALKAALANS